MFGGYGGWHMGMVRLEEVRKGDDMWRKFVRESGRVTVIHVNGCAGP